MSDATPPGRSSSDSANQVDPQRLTALLAQAVSLESAGDGSFVESALMQLNDVDRVTYRQPLLDQLQNAGTIQALAGDVDRLPDPTIAEPPPNPESSDAASADPALPTEASSIPGQQVESPSRVSVRGKKQPSKPLPDKIGKFRVQEELGRGGFGVVYLCIDEELQRSVAVKVSHLLDPSLQERLRVEASKVAQIESPGIVPVYHIGRTEGGNVYIVQKYIQGSTLRDLVKNSPLSPLLATEILRDIALGLEPAHLLEILHRDLKPDNVLIETNGQAWIADFGLAISEDEQEGCLRELAGTPPYMAPEQINGRVDFMDPRSDIWALGVMYYEMLTGKRPFRGKNREALKEQICELDPRPLQQRAPDHLTEAMNHIFLRCCAKKPSDRYATVRELANDLDDLIAGGLSDQNIHGASMLPPSGTSFANYAKSPSRRSVQRASNRGSTDDTISGVGTTADSLLSQSSILKQTRLLPAVAAMLVVITLSIAASVGYQMYAHSVVPLEDDVVDPRVLPPKQANLGVETAIQLTQEDPQLGPRNDNLSSDIMTPTAADRDEKSNAMGLDQANGSAEKPWVVSWDGSGSHRTISAAVAAGIPSSQGPDGSRTSRAHIKVKPGDYDEEIRITTPVMIEGVPEKVTYADGEDRYPCQILSGQGTPLLIDVADSQELVEIKYFSINGKRRDAKREFNAVDLTAGTLLLRNCELSTMSFNSIKARNGSRLATFDCKFHDSLQFAISTSGQNQVVAKDSDFYGDGIQLKGGSGNITGCNFYGSEGVYVSQSAAPANIENCTFTGNLDYGIASTNGGNVVSTKNSFLDCKKGVWVMVGDDVDNQPSDDLPATLELVNTSLSGCEMAVLVEGGTLKAKKDCKIVRGWIGVSVTTGTVTLTDMFMSELTKHGLSVTDMAEVTLLDCTLESTDAAAIQLSKGDLTVTGGRIADYQIAGIIVGDESHGPLLRATCKLHDVKISEADAPGIIAFSGPVTIENVSLDGGIFGLMAMGPEASELSSPPLVDISVDKSSSFLNQKEAGIFAKGDSRITLNSKSWRALSDEKGGKARVLAPARVDLE